MLVAISVIAILWYIGNVAWSLLRGIPRSEDDPLSYLVFGLASVVSCVIGFRILIITEKARFTDSAELLRQLIDVLEDGIRTDHPVSILYPSPNPGLWDHCILRKGPFKRYKELVEQCIERHKATGPFKFRICMLDGIPAVHGASLNEELASFAREFSESLDAEIPEKDKAAGREQYLIQQYLDESAKFLFKFSDLPLSTPKSYSRSHINREWMTKIVEGRLFIMAAANQRGFIGSMTLKNKDYKFEAVEFNNMVPFLHALYEHLVSMYKETPPTG
jgi:hypothetical protein